ncbi:MAG TPA: cell division protein ZapA [Blastocatellia bacterium]|nr:cell division protein ZapA [Blastocatellia bacterium]
MDGNQNQTVKVVIYNQTYNLRSDHESGYIQDLAAHVDAKMNEIARQTMTVDSLRVAILAALQITDELYQSRAEMKDTERELTERSTRYAELLDQFLRVESVEPAK